jgi:hypothetical protein
MRSPFCTHLIISSITVSEIERPKAVGGAARPGFDEPPRALPRETPFSGITRDAMVQEVRGRSGGRGSKNECIS